MPGSAAAVADGEAISSDGDGERAFQRRVLFGRQAPWRRVFSEGVVPQPCSETGLMGRLRPLSVVDVLLALAPRWGDVFLDAGDRDEHGLQIGARMVRDRLAARGVRVTHEEFPGGHRGTAWRYDVSIPLLLAEVARA